MTEPLRAALERLGLEEFHDLLAANDIDAAAIGELSDTDLRELGLNIGQRKRFQRGQARLADAAAAPAPVPVAMRAEHAAAERRQLTTLFCDLVGSTSLRTRLDPEDLYEVMERLPALCTDVLQRPMAAMSPLLSGDGFWCISASPTAREDDPERAVRAGLELASARPATRLRPDIVWPGARRHRHRARRRRRLVAPPSATGHVVGETPNWRHDCRPRRRPAARCLRRRPAASRGSLRLRGSAALHLKGFATPVACMHACSARGASTAASRPARRCRARPLIGRDAMSCR